MSYSTKTIPRRGSKDGNTKDFFCSIPFEKIKDSPEKKDNYIPKGEEIVSKTYRQLSSKIPTNLEPSLITQERGSQRKNYSFYESKYSKKDNPKTYNSSKLIKRIPKPNNDGQEQRTQSLKNIFKNEIKSNQQNNYKTSTFKPGSKDENKRDNSRKEDFSPNQEVKFNRKRSNTINLNKTSVFELAKMQAKAKESEQNKNKIIDNKIMKEQYKSSFAKSSFKNEENIIRRRKPNFSKFETRYSDKNLILIIDEKEEEKKDKKENSNMKNSTTINKQNKNDKTKNNVHFEKDLKIKGKKRRKSIDPGIRRKNTKQLIDFSQTTHIKLCKALSTAGRGDDGLTKINQDSYVLEKNINGILNFNIFGVLDGHGEFGHLASQFVKRYIINRIKNHPLIKGLDNPQEIYKVLSANGYRIITNIYIDADVQIKKEKFNCEMSGTTCVLVIELEEHLICANTGDSRAILVYSESSNNNLSSSQIYNLSYDFKPELPGEKKRIEECGGAVSQIIDEDDIPIGPFRVWKRGEEYPGLAMSRSIGDMDAKKIGVIPNPQVIEYTLNFQSKYMIICSDGIWEFISEEKAMKIGNKYYLRNDPLGLCQELTNLSTAEWLKEDIVVDDITAVVVFF